MFAVSPTNNKWFKYLKDNGLNSHVNFWTPTPSNLKGLQEGDRVYFMQRAPIKKIVGFGEFLEYKNISAEAAWNKFGYRNGRESKIDFINSIQRYIDKKNEKYGRRNLDMYSYQVGCIILRNCEFWDEKDQKEAAAYDLKFPMQKIKIFDEYDPFMNTDNSGLVKEPGENKNYVASKDCTTAFKGKILKAYKNSCCITGETIPELLEAAYIQEQKNMVSCHIRNALLLRVDMQRLFNNNLLYIDKDYTVHVSSLITDECYRRYNGKKIILPVSEDDHPLVEAFELRQNEFRR
jgi:putative restriction endonuclease